MCDDVMTHPGSCPGRERQGGPHQASISTAPSPRHLTRTHIDSHASHERRRETDRLLAARMRSAKDTFGQTWLAFYHLLSPPHGTFWKKDESDYPLGTTNPLSAPRWKTAATQKGWLSPTGCVHDLGRLLGQNCSQTPLFLTYGR